MNRFRFLLGPVLATACLLVSPAIPAAESATTPPQPPFVIDSTSLDLGGVPEGEAVTAAFAIHNAGQAEPKILKAKPS